MSREEDVNNNQEKPLKFPFEIVKVDREINEKLLKDFTGERTGFVQVGRKKYFFPSGYEREAANYYNFESRPDDVWVLTYPRSGTTWTQEMVWLLANDLNFEKAKSISLLQRFPFLEFSAFIHKETKAEFLEENKSDPAKFHLVQNIDVPAWKTLSCIEKDTPRFIKTHLPFSLLSPNLLETGCKVVYVARNPKDVAVSFYHLNRTFRTQGYVGDFEKYWEYFEADLQAWSPFWEHLREGWERRDHPNVLFVFYEELSKDPRGAIERMSKFLGKTYTKLQLDLLEAHLKIDNFRVNKSVNFNELREVGVLLHSEEGFVRKGKNGGWRAYFTPELEARAERWIQKNLDKTDLRFPTV